MALVKCAYRNTEPIESNINVLDLTKGKIHKNADKEYYWDGSAILDKLLHVLGQNLKTQLDNGWIEGSEYANAYVRMMEIATMQAMAWIKMSKDIAAQNRQLDQADNKNSADVCLQNNKLTLEEKVANDKLVLEKQKVDNDFKVANDKLVLEEKKIDEDVRLQENKLALEEKKVDSDIKVARRQIAGYSDNIAIKLLQAELDAFALIYSSGMLDNPDLGPLNVNNLHNAYNTLVQRI